MSRKAIFSVVVDGLDISSRLNPILISLRVSDAAGSASDTAQMDLDDTGGQVILPSEGAQMTVMLGFEDTGLATVFAGVVDEVRSRGDRGGRVLSVSAKGFDSGGKAKEPQQKHFDKKSVKDILTEAGRDAGITDLRVDSEFASIIRDYEQMDDESFINLGRRLASELGGTFKISGNRAALAKRNGGTAPSGKALSVVSAIWGVNMLSWEIAPFLGRGRYKRSRARYYDKKEAKWKEVLTETDDEDAEATTTDRFAAPAESEAEQKTKNDKANSEREGGEGSVSIDGNTAAQAEGNCIVSGARPGIDGTYRIESIEHEYSRSGFITRLSLKQPQGSAGKDGRK
ncbi:late control protein [Phyllobacterium sp. LjRoot231]|uniref:phage late control D family protein n=1 Tax=Phyllobacterium sp. LjRoot231 TaxID=3342289 RepID=UPI003ECFE03E